MEARLLRYFAAVANEGTVSAAAISLGISQPALSRQLKQLESITGLALFQRLGIRLVLTSEGREFLHVAREVLLKMEHANQVAKQLASGQLPSISLAAPATTLNDVIAPFVATFEPTDPAPSISEIPIDPDLTRLLPRFDLSVTTQRPPAEVSALPLAQLAVFAQVPTQHRWANETTIDVNQLVGEQLLLPSQDFKARLLLDGAMQMAGIRPTAVVETAHGRVAQALAAAGRGVAVLSDDPQFGLVPLAVNSAGIPLRIQLFAAWRPDHHAADQLGDIASRLQAFCRERYGETLSADAL